VARTIIGTTATALVIGTVIGATAATGFLNKPVLGFQAGVAGTIIGSAATALVIGAVIGTLAGKGCTGMERRAIDCSWNRQESGGGKQRVSKDFHGFSPVWVIAISRQVKEST
jgi:hypothetical protein